VPEAIEKKQYTCGVCKVLGHNARKCPERKGAAPPPPPADAVSAVSAAPPKKKLIKRKLIASKDQPKVVKPEKKVKVVAKASAPKVAKAKVKKASAAPAVFKEPKPKKAKVAKEPVTEVCKDVLCRHSSIESFTDEGGGGVFSECGVCKARGPLCKTQKEAVAALRAMKALRPHLQGGYRSGGGGRKILDETAKLHGYQMEDKHVAVLVTYAEILATKNKSRLNKSAAMRHLLEALGEDPKILARLAKRA